jgi:hypothetical protein
MTASLKRGRPVALPVSRAMAAISATMRARFAECWSCAADNPECVIANKKSPERKMAIMRARPLRYTCAASEAARSV